jgi:hypothetical protein
MAALALAEAALPPALAERMRAERGRLDELCRSDLCRVGRLDTLDLERRTKGLIRDAYLEVYDAQRAAESG